MNGDETSPPPPPGGPAAEPRRDAPKRRAAERRRALLIGPVGLLAVLAGLWLVGLMWFAGAVPKADKDLSQARAIVVLTGGSDRVRTGLAALEDNPQAKLFISGVPARVGPDDLWRALGEAPSDQVAGRIVLGHAAADTQGNARETAAWIRRTGYRTVRLVTAAYHMRRALLELRAQMPDVRFLPDPVYPAHVKQDEWWRYPGTAALLAMEFNKYLVAWGRLTLGLGAPDGADQTPEPGAS